MEVSKVKKTTEQQVLALFVQAMRTALAIIDEKEKTAEKPADRSIQAAAPGIYPAKSKYNPWRAYAWTGEKSVYLGQFPTVAKAKAAQKAYLAGQQPKDGTRVANHRPPLEVVKKAKAA